MADIATEFEPWRTGDTVFALIGGAGCVGITVAVLVDEEALIVVVLVPAEGPVTADDARADTSVVPVAADDADAAVSLARLVLGHCGRSQPFDWTHAHRFAARPFFLRSDGGGPQRARQLWKVVPPTSI